ncbi:MAG: C45 family autoproteolytic acyltransferase/hydrolase, partial [Nocardioidaceae bacterium]
MKIDVHDSGDLAATERGERFGQVWADRIRAATDAYRDHYRRLEIDADTVATIADASHDALRDWYPSLAAELESMARGARLTVPEIGILTARTEILAAWPGRGDGECSTAVRVPADGTAASTTPMAFQTWDWHAHLVPHAALWRYAPSPGAWVKTFTEPGMPAKIGVNSRGLAANFNILHHRDDSTSGGVPVHAVARRILDEAATVDEARGIAESARVSASTAITVVATAGGRPEAASLEITPAGTAAIGIDADGWLVRTNHLLAPELRDGNASPATSTTTARRDHLRGAVPEDLPDGLTELARRFCGPAGA